MWGIAGLQHPPTVSQRSIPKEVGVCHLCSVHKHFPPLDARYYVFVIPSRCDILTDERFSHVPIRCSAFFRSKNHAKWCYVVHQVSHSGTLGQTVDSSSLGIPLILTSTQYAPLSFRVQSNNRAPLRSVILWKDQFWRN